MRCSLRSILVAVACAALLCRFGAYAVEIYRSGDHKGCVRLVFVFTLGLFTLPLGLLGIGKGIASRYARRSSLISLAALMLGLTAVFVCGLSTASFIYRLADPN